MKDKIILKAKLMITDVKRKSTSPALKGAKRWDIIHLSSPVEAVGRNTRGTHAAYIKVQNGRTGQISYVSYNQAPKFFEAIEYDVIHNG